MNDPLHGRTWHLRLMRSFLGILTLVFLLTSVSSLHQSALGEPAPVLIRNAALIMSMDPSVGEGPLGLLKDSDLLLIGDTIKAIGPNLQTRGETIYATGKIVLPGFVDVHNHLWQTLIRGCGTNLDLLDWLKECTFAFKRLPYTEADIAAGVRLSTLDLITTGVTTVADWSPASSQAFVRGNLRALDESGLRFVFAYVGLTKRQDPEHIRRINREIIEPNPRASLQVGSHPSMDKRWLPELTAMSMLARELDVALHVHLLENIKQRQGKPILALKKAKAFGGKLLAAHAIHLTDQDIAILAKHDVRAAHNPLSNMRLASGIMPLPKLHAAGIKVGLGLDGGTNDTSDMFNAMRVAIGLQRATTLRPDVFPTVQDVLRMATIGGAEVLELDAKIGSLTPGKKADVIILDPGTVNFAPRVDWLSQIVFNGQPRNVEWVFVDGQPLKANGQLLNVDPAAIVREVEEAVRRLRHAPTN